MLDENKKFIVLYILLVVITILHILELRSVPAAADDSLLRPPGGPYPAVDDPLLRQPGGYHYDRVKSLAAGAQKKINTNNPTLDLEKCRQAYLAYYSRQTEEEARNALLTIHNCER